MLLLSFRLFRFDSCNPPPVPILTFTETLLLSDYKQWKRKRRRRRRRRRRNQRHAEAFVIRVVILMCCKSPCCLVFALAIVKRFSAPPLPPYRSPRRSATKVQIGAQSFHFLRRFGVGSVGERVTQNAPRTSLCKSLAADAATTIRNASVPSILLNLSTRPQTRATQRYRYPPLPSSLPPACLPARLLTVIVSCLCFVCN